MQNKINWCFILNNYKDSLNTTWHQIANRIRVDERKKEMCGE